MASNSNVFLLDEAMSAMDWWMKSKICASNIFSGKTVVYASHDAGIGSTNRQIDMTKLLQTSINMEG
jgi:ABC-type bacteriocin/lantibiotic exporter with double-glycine peptidase domain